MGARVVASIVGARPQFIKAAPLSRALARGFKEILVHTGQHYDYGMSDVFFQEMEIRTPDFNLGVGSSSHGEQTARMLMKLEQVLVSIKPECVIVYGDTNSTLAGALAAVQARIPLAHVEAGLRSYDRGMPEEINRLVTDRIAEILFCPTSQAVENLAREGIIEGVHQVGDLMADALAHNLPLARERSRILQSLHLAQGKYALATLHRAANTDDPDRLRSILAALSSLPVKVVFPVHPRTRKLLDETAAQTGSNVLLLEPLGYFDSLVLQENADCILTDSGGMQREAYLLGVRCITLREETEWVETVAAGWNKLAGVDGAAIRAAFEGWRPAGQRLALYGDGKAAERICQILAEFLT